MKRKFIFKLLSVFTAMIFLLQGLVCAAVEAEIKLKGDVNADGVTDISDVVLIRAYIVSNRTFTAEQYMAADVTKDNIIDITDVVAIRYIIVNPITDTEVMYGVWFSYLDFNSLLKGKDETNFSLNFQNVIDNCKNIGINTLIVHARSHGDAFYESSLFPTSSYLSGTLGKDLDYDAFKIMVDMCHKNGIKVHAWVNPLRLQSANEMQGLSDSYILKQWYSTKNGTYVVNVNESYYLNCAYDEVRQFVCDGIAEIVNNYEVDGIHIDDYFYPTTESYYDADAFESSGYTDLSEFRLSVISHLVSSIYSTIKSIDSNVLFGVSPQGNISNNYNNQFADVRRWCSEKGFIDYIAPQIYYGFKNKTSPFEKTASQWQEIVSESDVKLVCGLATYKIGKTDTYAGSQDAQSEWITEENIVARQMQYLSSTSYYDGVLFFRYDLLFNPQESLKPSVDTELNAIKQEIIKEEH